MLIHSLIQQQNTTWTEHLHVPDPHLIAEDRVVQRKYGPCPMGAFILVEIQHLYALPCDHHIVFTPKTNIIL